jgi:hypothetical protein
MANAVVLMVKDLILALAFAIPAPVEQMEGASTTRMGLIGTPVLELVLIVVTYLNDEVGATSIFFFCCLLLQKKGAMQLS